MKRFYGITVLDMEALSSTMVEGDECEFLGFEKEREVCQAAIITVVVAPSEPDAIDAVREHFCESPWIRQILLRVLKPERRSDRPWVRHGRVIVLSDEECVLEEIFDTIREACADMSPP